jgi:hypothetical protein
MSRRRLVLVSAVLLVSSRAALGPVGCPQISIDACLDAGGRWDYAAQKCER